MDKMTEAQFMGMLVVALAGLFALLKIIAKPLIMGLTELTKSITSLDLSVQSLKGDMEELKNDLSKEAEHGTTARRRLWEHNKEQDEKIQEHDRRIYKLEQKE